MCVRACAKERGGGGGGGRRRETMSEKERESSVIHPSANAHLGKKCQRKVGEEGRQCESSTQVRRIDLTSRGGDREGEQLISQWVSRR